jgi:Leucine-rich repeat (LRR) protein
MRFYNLTSALQQADHAEELILHRQNLSSFPTTLFQLSNLRKLEISACQLKHIPSEIGTLPHLEQLALPNNNLQEIPQSLTALKQLKLLDLSGNEFQQLPDFIGIISSLETLILSDNQLQEIPEALHKLNTLSKLDLSSNQIRNIPSKLCQLKQLRQLNLSNNQLKRLPNKLQGWENLDSLNLRQNQLNKLPDMLGKLSQLRRLDLSKNRLKSVPDSIGDCTYLRQLYLQRNILQELPDSIGKLKWLALLDCAGNKLTALPESLKDCTQLQELNGSKNLLSSLSKSLEQLERMRTLQLDENQLTSITACPPNLVNLYLNKNKLSHFPKCLLNLSKLKTLHIAKNQIIRLPQQIGKLSALEKLNIGANPIKEEPKSLIFLPNLKSLYGFTFFPAKELLQFNRACKKLTLDASTREKLYQLYREPSLNMTSLPISILFQGLQLNLPQLTFSIKAHIFQKRSLNIIEYPLQQGSTLAIFGKTHFGKKTLKQRIAPLGIETVNDSQQATSHVLLGKQPDYAHWFEQGVVFLSEKMLNDFLAIHENQYLSKETDPEKIAHLRQLLLHEKREHTKIALQLLKSGGVPMAILTSLFFIYKTHQDQKIRAAVKKLLDINLSGRSLELIAKHGNLSKNLSREKRKEKLEKLAEVEEFNAEELYQYFGKE